MHIGVVVMQNMSEAPQVIIWNLSTICFCTTVASLLLSALPLALVCLLLAVAVRAGEVIRKPKGPNREATVDSSFVA